MSDGDRSLPKFGFSGYWDLLGMYFGLSGQRLTRRVLTG